MIDIQLKEKKKKKIIYIIYNILQITNKIYIYIYIY